MKRSIFVLGTPVVLLFASLFAMPTSSAEDTSKVVDSKVTFTKDVAPIFYKNCTACHRPGEVAPMSNVDPATGLVTVESGTAVRIPLRMDDSFEGEFTLTAIDPVTGATFGAPLTLRTDYVE